MEGKHGRRHWANDSYLRHFLREVQDFIGPTRAVLVTCAGAIRTHIDPLDRTLDSLRSGLASLQNALLRLELRPSYGRQQIGSAAQAEPEPGSQTPIPQEILVGVDGCLAGRKSPLQTVVHLRGEPRICLPNVAIKIYPSGKGEESSLIGWRICRKLKRIPDEFTPGRRVQTAVGTILVLVCHDAAIFSGRSRKNAGRQFSGHSQRSATSQLRLQIREHFLHLGMMEPRPTYILVATHWQQKSLKDGRLHDPTFRNATEYLSKTTGATVVITMRALKNELDDVAGLFEVVGPRKDKVATLIVEETQESVRCHS
jgi:hypothetical protein